MQTPYLLGYLLGEEWSKYWVFIFHFIWLLRKIKDGEEVNFYFYFFYYYSDFGGSEKVSMTYWMLRKKLIKIKFAPYFLVNVFVLASYLSSGNLGSNWFYQERVNWTIFIVIYTKLRIYFFCHYLNLRTNSLTGNNTITFLSFTAMWEYIFCSFPFLANFLIVYKAFEFLLFIQFVMEMVSSFL